jgi:hypothetical protein
MQIVAPLCENNTTTNTKKIITLRKKTKIITLATKRSM